MRKSSYKKRNTRQKTLRLKTLFGVIPIVVIVASLAVGDALNLFDLPGFRDNSSASSTSKINYGPPTEQEKQETEEFKNDLGSDKDSATPPEPSVPGEKIIVKPVLTSWIQNSSTQNLEGAGFVPGVIENGGTCSLTATKGSQKITESIPATQNAQNISCGMITIPREKLSSGTWKLTLSYSSSSSEGTSEPRTQEVE